MKKVLILVTASLLSLSAFAQTLDYKKGEDVSGKLADSIKYYLPQFTRGNILYKDGSRSTGIVNITTFNQSVHYKAEDGQIMNIADIESVASVSVGRHLFIRYKSLFYELTAQNGSIYLASNKTLYFLDEQKPGAYGTASPTSAVTSYTSIDYNGENREIGGNHSTKYKYRHTPWLYNSKSFIRPSKKNFIKLFPAKAAEIEAYCQANRVDFDDYYSVLNLFNAIK